MEQHLDQHLRLMAALKMYELGKIFAGKAGELASLSPPQFFESCGMYGVSILDRKSTRLTPVTQ